MGEDLLFNRYQILERLDHNGASEVFRAFDTRMERPVAIKKIASRPKARDRAVREAKTVASLNHAKIVTLYDFMEASGSYFLIMEYLEGHTLSAILQVKARLTPEEAAAAGLDVCRALEYAHGKKVVHRDIKPHNLNLDPDGRLKVMDFGIARLWSSELTREGEVLGTFAYMSPEQADGLYVDKTTDIWSLGATLYQFLTGEPPFTGETPAAIVRKILSQDPPAPSQINPDLSKDWDRIVLKALQKDPVDRFQSARELENRLAAAVERGFARQRTLKTLAADAKAAEIAPTRRTPRQWLAWAADRKSLVKNVIGSAFIAFNFWLLGPELFFYPTEAFYLFLGVLALAGLYRLDLAVAVSIGLFALPLLINSFASGVLLAAVLTLYWFVFTRKQPFNSLVPWMAPFLSLIKVGLAFPLVVGVLFPPLTAGLIGALGALAVELFGILLARPLLEVSFTTVGGGTSPWQALSIFLDEPFLVFQIGLWGLAAVFVSVVSRREGILSRLAAVFGGSLFLAIGYTSLPIPLGISSPAPELVLQALSFSLIILLSLVAVRSQGRAHHFRSPLEKVGGSRGP